MGKDTNHSRVPHHRDPKYVKDQLAKSKTDTTAVNPPEELSVTEAVAETQEAPTIADALSEEVRAGVEQFLNDNGIPTTETFEVLGDSEESQLVDKTPKAKAVKAPKEPKEPKEATVHSRMLAGNCRVCGKVITNPTSMHRGVGPVCYSAMVRTFKWTDADTKNHVDNDTDEEWTALVEQIHELLYKADSTVTTVPEGYVEMSKWWREAEKHNLTASAISRAVGGDRTVGEPLGEEFVTIYVQIGKRARKFLPPESMTEAAFKKIADSQKPRQLTGAALEVKKKADAKKAAASTAQAPANVTALPDGSFS